MRDATRITDYFNGSRALFIIPLYQRKYAWQQKHRPRLFEDLKRIYRDNIYSHFFGSIVQPRLMNTRMTILAYLFKSCNIPAPELEFELAPLADNVIEEEESDI